MPPITRPSVRQWYLARRLKELRIEAGVSVKDVCAHLGISQPTVVRIEDASVSITPTRVEQLLELYGVPLAIRSDLIRTAKEASKHGLWQAGADIWPSGYVNLERDADSIFAFELAYVPGLLQTDEYYRALLRAGMDEPQDPDEIERKVSGRIGRQSLLTRDDAPQLHVVLGEAVLRQVVGGPQLMRRQLLHLCEASNRPNVTVQVVPFVAGAYPGLEGCFTILTFDEYGMQVGYTEGPAGHIYSETPPALAGINVRREGVLKAALSPSASVAFLRKAAGARVKE